MCAVQAVAGNVESMDYMAYLEPGGAALHPDPAGKALTLNRLPAS